MKRREFIKSSTAAGLMATATPLVANDILRTTQEQALNGQQPFRQIHLDFHTSEKILNIGGNFDPKVFASTLKKAHVNSINCFAKGHHGWLYYVSKRFPERKHPHLQKDLLKLQADALHKEGIKVTAYVSLQADLQTAIAHPEWRNIKPDGSMDGGPIGNASFWKSICLNSPYVELLKEQISDVAENVDVDGFWLDILRPKDCSCKYCKERMAKKGLDINSSADRIANGEEVMVEFTTTISKHIRDINKDYLIYYNSGHVAPYNRKVADNYTHYELESLSSSEKWGYPFFQNEARYVRGLGKQFVGMTGKFHSVWGDFHSFKNKYALEFDCFQSLALTGKCCVGDQLHPEGVIDQHTYDLVGSVYGQVARKEPWCEGATPMAEMAVFHEEEFAPGLVNSHPGGLWGANKMLLEGGYQYDVIDTKSELEKYKILILPDRIPVEGKFKAKLEEYVENGGALICSFESGMDNAKSDFVSPIFGVGKSGDGPNDESGSPVRGRTFYNNNYAQYILPRGKLGDGLRPTEYVMHMRGVDVKPLPGAEVLMDNVKSYFDRTPEHFCSHLQTPSSGKKGLPAVVKSGNVIYFAHPVFSQYNENAAPWCRQLVHNAIDELMPQRLMKTSGPSTLVATINKQAHKNRMVAHFLHYIPMQRGLQFQTIEEVIPLHDIEVEIRIGKKVKEVKLVPENIAVNFTQGSGVLLFAMPKIEGHEMVEIN